MPDYAYAGSELDLFAHAANWKSYFRSRLAPYLRGDVLEVGAGIGATTRLLCDGTQRSWTCLEPDPRLASRLRGELDGVRPADAIDCVVGTLADLPAERRFDAILYVDVMEHIPDDAGEFARAADRLKPGGVLAILAPAHQWLFSPFDRSVGHCRRYAKRSLRRLADGCPVSLERLFYLDSAGLVASVGNRFLLRSGMPTAGQIRVWDRLLVPVSRRLDPLLRNSVGKSVVGVWRRPAG